MRNKRESNCSAQRIAALNQRKFSRPLCSLTTSFQPRQWRANFFLPCAAALSRKDESGTRATRNCDKGCVCVCVCARGRAGSWLKGFREVVFIVGAEGICLDSPEGVREGGVLLSGVDLAGEIRCEVLCRRDEWRPRDWGWAFWSRWLESDGWELWRTARGDACCSARYMFGRVFACLKIHYVSLW